LSVEQLRQVAAWFEKSSARLPEPVRAFLALHVKYLSAGVDVRQSFEATVRELRRALGISASSERRRSGNPLAGVPREQRRSAEGERARLEEQHERITRLGDWHLDLALRHEKNGTRMKDKLTKMSAQPDQQCTRPEVSPQESTEEIPVEEIELTPEEKAANAAATARLVSHLDLGAGADPALQSVNETLMPGGAVLAGEQYVSLEAEVPEPLAGAKLVKTLIQPRVRYDFSVSVTRIDLDVEKKVLVEEDGTRHVVAASTRELGPPRYAVTWPALATLAVMVGQFAMPFNRLATMLSTAGKRFTTGSLSRMLHYVAQRLVPVYLELARQVANSEVIGGDDTSCRVLEVAAYFEEGKAGASPPWADYRTPEAAEATLRRREEARRERERRRAEGERGVKRVEEDTSLGAVIGTELVFESLRRNGNGTKQSLNTTVISGRSIVDDPRSLVVFYRSHLGGYGNLVEALLRHRDREAREVTLQGDLSTTNLVTSPELLSRLKVKQVGCSAHARRPFALYEHEDRCSCAFMLHLFRGLAIHEQQLDVFGRNRENVLAVRQQDSRALWERIRKLAQEMTKTWSPATKLGTAARYIVKHYTELTAYLDDPRLEPSNNLRERMLRTEKLIEASSMFRKSLEGRFALDVVRTVLQTAVAAGVSVHEYLESVLRADPEEISAHPERFTPRAWTLGADMFAAAQG
jgi:hypothetical protein